MALARPRPPDLNEAEFTAQVVDLARFLGWETAHFRPAKTQRGWRTPVSGTLGMGFPDWIFVRERDRRLIFAELKAAKGRISPDQERVAGILSSLDTGIRPVNAARVQVFTWWAGDLDAIVEVMR